MGTITLTVRDDVEERFRKMVGERSSRKKGSLGRAVTEAMELWIHDKEQEEVSKRALELMEQSFDMGERRFAARGNLHG
jgi:hypothetical protein